MRWVLRRSSARALARSARVYIVNEDDPPPRPNSQGEAGVVATVPTPTMDSPRASSDTAHRVITIDGVEITGRHQTLQLLFVCEVLLFAEYMEVVIPVLYAFVLGGEWLLPNAPYNVVVNSLTGAQAVQQVWTSLLYALLELASMLAMYYVMRRRYGVSAFVQLAFVLETYWMTLQGKLVGSFIVVMNALTIHQGADGFSRL